MNITQFIVYKTDNPEEMTTLGTQDTGRKQKKNRQKIKHRILKWWAAWTSPKTGRESRWSQVQAISMLDYRLKCVNTDSRNVRLQIQQC